MVVRQWISQLVFAIGLAYGRKEHRLESAGISHALATKVPQRGLLSSFRITTVPTFFERIVVTSFSSEEYEEK